MSYFEPGSNLFYGMELDEHQQVFVKALQNPKKTIVFCNAVAGTGKTTLAMGLAVRPVWWYSAPCLAGLRQDCV